MQKLDIKEIFLRNIDNFKDKNIIVGFSGGADSTALLMLFYEFKDYLKINLEAAHFNHQWRDTAINDQLFCKEFCQKLNIKLNINYVLGAIAIISSLLGLSGIVMNSFGLI